MAARTPPSILIVDDTPDNLRLLAQVLGEQPYVVRPAVNGPRALAAAQAELPDLILLDIKMPDMDGYAVCEQLKADPRTREIPVIFISALNDVEDKVKGLALGGADYISKPFQAAEVLARVRAHLELRALQTSAEERNQRLQHEIAQRQQAEAALQIANQQLEAANHALRKANAGKDAFFSIIAHDLRAPFTGLLNLTEALIENLDHYTPEKLITFLRRIHASAQKIYALLTNLLTWSRLERGMVACEPEDFSLASLAGHACAILGPNAEQKRIAVKNLVPADLQVHADLRMIDTVLRNLLTNAVKFTGAGGEIRIAARPRDGEVEVAVSDTGVGLSPEMLAKLFRIETKISTPGTAGEEGTGLGLILCKDFIERNHGTLWVESAVGQGSAFFFTVPRAQELTNSTHERHHSDC